jgi:predicted nucleotidyltransferase
MTAQRISADHRARIIAALLPFRPAVIYLFGSFGTDRQHPASDIDIAFIPTLPADPLTCFQISNTLADGLGYTVDLVNLRNSSTVMAKEVLLTGIPLEIQREDIQQEFEMLTLSDYARLNEERAAILAS